MSSTTAKYKIATISCWSPTFGTMCPFNAPTLPWQMQSTSQRNRVAIGQWLERLAPFMKKPFADPSTVPEEFSTGGAPFDVKGYIFDEDVWSLRLAGCLRLFLPHRLDVKMMGKLGKQFAANQMVYTGVPVYLCSCYPFHGAPNITIKSFPIILHSDTEAEGEEPESGNEPDSIIENSQQAPRQVEYPPKLGELFATMHMALVKKILKMFVQKKKHEEVELVCHGLLLSKANGGIMCKMNAELKKNKPGELNFHVHDFACEVLTPAALCSHLQRLLRCDIHR